jgi:Flp pilus assembly protein TadG
MGDLRQFVLVRLRRRRRILRAQLRLLRDDAGSALVELAVMLAILGVPLLLAAAHFAILLTDSIIVANAAHAGAEYGMQSATFAGDTAYIQTEAQDDSGMGSNLTVTPTVFYVCSSAIGGTQYSTNVAASAACSGGNNHALEFIQVVASATVTPAVRVPGFADTVTLSSTSTMEVEE